MKVPKNFKTRIGGNFYQNTEKLIVCRDEPILSVQRDDDTGNPLQTNIGNRPSGETFRNADAALVVPGSPHGRA